MYSNTYFIGVFVENEHYSFSQSSWRKVFQRCITTVLLVQFRTSISAGSGICFPVWRQTATPAASVNLGSAESPVVAHKVRARSAFGCIEPPPYASSKASRARSSSGTAHRHREPTISPRIGFTRHVCSRV